MHVESVQAPGATSGLRDFHWPPLGDQLQPIWTGTGFLIGGRPVAVLSYETEGSGWTDRLTTFHEETAGSNHPIDIASRTLALEGLSFVRAPAPIVLEIGCSSGFMLGAIRERLPSARLIGSDVVLGPLEALASSSPEIPLLHFDLTHCPLADESVDALVMLNVLEHIRDDAAALRQAFRILRSGGVLVLEVPAGPELFDVYDELLMHYRRYRLPDLQRLLAATGFELERATHLGVLMYPAFYLVKLKNRRLLTRAQSLKQRVVAQNIRSTASSQVLELLFRLELAAGRRVSWPFGIRCVVAARKP